MLLCRPIPWSRFLVGHLQIQIQLCSHLNGFYYANELGNYDGGFLRPTLLRVARDIHYDWRATYRVVICFLRLSFSPGSGSVYEELDILFPVYNFPKHPILYQSLCFIETANMLAKHYLTNC